LAQIEDPFHWTFDTTKKEASPGDTLPLEVFFRIPSKHFLYRDKMTLSLVEGDGFELGESDYSPSMKKQDPFSGKLMDIFEAGAVLKIPLKVNAKIKEGEKTVKLLLSYQGCSDTLCFRLMKKEILLPVVIVPSGSANATGQSSHLFRDHGFWVILLLSFLGGIASDLTPCVLPIIPITLAFIGVRRSGTSFGKNFFLTQLFVLSMALTYAVMGLLAASLGKSLGFLFQNFYFLAFSSLLYLSFALSLFGFFEIQVPLPVRNFMAKLGGEGPLGAMLSGVTVGFLAAPCVGPLIASLLLYVAQEKDLFRGFVFLFAYGFGMGSLFMVVGIFYHRLASRIHGGAFTVWIKRVMAVLLLIPAIYYGTIAYGHLRHQPVKVVQETFWMLDAKEGFAKAAKEKKPLFVDFFATWCLPCVEMETKTFSNAEVQKLLTESFVPIKINCTEDSPQCKEMVERYSILGWPTFLILDTDGKVLETIVGKNLSPRQLIQILEMSLNK
ncbi:MAG: thioredoxin family protein, partial [Deltaproteobacteria bacterium]|nr:thioredoxin family protein [Deltaproteobacteria bacterium]